MKPLMLSRRHMPKRSQVMCRSTIASTTNFSPKNSIVKMLWDSNLRQKRRLWLKSGRPRLQTRLRRHAQTSKPKLRQQSSASPLTSTSRSANCRTSVPKWTSKSWNLTASVRREKWRFGKESPPLAKRSKIFWCATKKLIGSSSSLRRGVPPRETSKTSSMIRKGCLLMLKQRYSSYKTSLPSQHRTDNY